MNVIEQNDKDIDSLQKRYKKILLLTVFFISVITIILFFASIKNISVHNKEIMIETAKITKERDLIDTVNNIIVRIDTKNTEQIERYKQLISLIKLDMSDEKVHYSEFIKKIEEKFYIPIYFGINIIILSDNDEILYLKNEYEISNRSELIKNLQIKAAVFEMFDLDNLSVVLWVDKDFIENEVKDYIGQAIHAMQYSENQYVWVNEVLNFNGGDDYAIRRVHPNLRNTEGEYLSTNTEDMIGNLPYQMELDGINKNEEITFEYYFKNLDSDKIEKKMTYAKLYKNYNWIVATGIPISEMENYVVMLRKYNKNFLFGLTIFIFIVILLLLFINLYIINKMGGIYNTKITKFLHDETEKDMLTGCFNRKIGDKLLNNAFSDFLDHKKQYAIFLCDIDDFKQVNDQYGHYTGDIVLKRTVEEIQYLIRGENNKLIRWGGEEFVILCQNIEKNQYKTIALKIINKIYSIPFSHDEGEFNVSLSIGVSLFDSTDESYQDSLKRADKELYYVKNHGKNQCKFCENNYMES